MEQRNLHTQKKDYSSILDSSREIEVSIILHFCLFSLTDKIIVEKMLICEWNKQRKNKTSNLITGRENCVSFQTYLKYEQTNGWTDICNNRVASLLKIQQNIYSI